uniref:Uncharacterized protein n=1 Tax=Knipowitschia caucasica TaxID=637954 RepID=A0AAV2LD85_KNICA
MRSETRLPDHPTILIIYSPTQDSKRKGACNINGPLRYVSAPTGLRFYTDAAPSVGFGGFFQDHWVAGPWPLLPPEHLLCPTRDIPSGRGCALRNHTWQRKRISVMRDNLDVVEASHKAPYSPFLQDRRCHARGLAGAPPPLQQLGCWFSSAFSAYISPDASAILAAQRLLTSS